MTTRARYHFPNLLEAFFIVIVLFFVEYFVDALIWKTGFDSGLQKIEIQSIGRLLSCGLVFTVLLHYSGMDYHELVHDSRRSWLVTLAVPVIPVLLLTPGLLLIDIALQNLLLLFFPLSQSMTDTMHSLLSGNLGAIAR